MKSCQWKRTCFFIDHKNKYVVKLIYYYKKFTLEVINMFLPYISYRLLNKHNQLIN